MAQKEWLQMSHKSYQSGFAALEALLIVVIVGIIGGTGWYVWHSKQATDKTLNAAAHSQQVVKSPSTPATADQKQYLVIKEWNVKVQLSDPIKDATYQIVATNKYLKPSAFLSTKTLDNSVACKNYYTQGATADNSQPTFQYIERFALTDQTSLDEGQTNISAQQAAKQQPEAYKQVGNYVYYYGHGNGMPCSDELGAQESGFDAAFDTIKSATD